MTPAASRYVLREAVVSAAINAAISVGFFLAVFGGMNPVPVWGVGNYAFDFAPQSFAVGLMASLVPGLLARKALAGGRVGPARTDDPTIGAVGVRSLVSGIATLIAGTALCAVLLWIGGVQTIDRTPAFALKVVYGAILGGLVTSLMLARMFANGENAR